MGQYRELECGSDWFSCLLVNCLFHWRSNETAAADTKDRQCVVELPSECGCTWIHPYIMLNCMCQKSNFELKHYKWDGMCTLQLYNTAFPKNVWSTLFAYHFTSHLCFRERWLRQTGRAPWLFHQTKALCLSCRGLLSPLGKHCCRTGLLDLAEFWIQTQACLSERLSQHNSCSAKETWSRGNTPHPSSPQVFSNSTPLDVWEAQLVVDHKALNHCLLIKHSTQRMRTGSPSPECQQWLQMRLGSPRWSISLQADIMALCLAKGNGNFTGYRFPGFILYFLSQPRWGLSTNRIGADFWFMTIKG